MTERVFNHLIQGGEILIPDKKSLKAGYGSGCPEAYPSDDPRFLNEVQVDMGNQPPRRGFVVSPPSEGWITQNYGRIGDGVVILELENPSGTFSEMGVHESRLWKHLTDERTIKQQLLKEQQLA